jgi:predicted ATPase/class 3 adenylate cyclase/Tfp pilus assembly protein PilF
VSERSESGTTGVLNFLFSDIEGSSRRWETSPEAMRTAVEMHNVILDRAIAKFDGRVFKRVGDEFCCVFERPADAVSAAVTVQRDLAQTQWPDELDALRVRIGIHSGTALAIEGGDFAGPALNRTARVMAAGHGDQILISASAANLVRDGLPADIELRNLGTHRLRDLRHEEALFQVVAPGLRDAFAKIKTLDTHPNNLPAQISSFVGRAEDIRKTLELLEHNRLVTIAGPGGIGKTCLGLQIASELTPQYGDGCWFIALADIRDPSLVPAAIASILDVREEPGRPIFETLATQLKHKRMLLLLDNSEHLLASVAQTIARLSAECSGVVFLVTSREPTHVTGERVVRIDPLDSRDAVELFLQRAQLTGGPSTTAAEHDAIESICRTLDGIPLAIELAAARTQTLLPQELADGLRNRPGLLVSKDPLGTPRHRTLAATIEWSFTLLDAAEQKLLQRLSVFDGGFTTRAGEEVAFDPDEMESFVDGLDSLVDKSFVRAIRAGDSTRYRMLDPIRSFLLKLLERDAASDVARRHFSYFKRLAANWDLQAKTPESTTASEMEIELPNLRAALSWGFDEPSKSAAVELLISLVTFWQSRGNIAEGRTWLTRVLEYEDLSPAERAGLLRRASTFAAKQDDYEAARRHIQASREIYESLGDKLGIAQAFHALAVIEHLTGDFDSAFDNYGRALEGFDAAGHVHGKITAITNRAIISGERGELDEARQGYITAIDLCRSSGHLNDLSLVLGAYAGFKLEHEDVKSAEPLLKEALEIKRRISNREALTDLLANLALLHARQGALEPALEYAREELQVAVEDRGNSLLIPAIELFALLLHTTGERARAATLLAIAVKQRALSHYGVVTRLNGEETQRIASEPEYAATLADETELEDLLGIAKQLLQTPPRVDSAAI